MQMSVVKIVIPLLSLESACWWNCPLLWRIRNHSSVRHYLTSKQSIPFLKHVVWFYRELLCKKSTMLFLVKKNKKAIGFVLLRNFSADAKKAEIGVMVRNSEQYRFIVPYIMTLAVYYSVHYLGLDSLYSYVSQENLLAQSLNSRFGGKLVPSDKRDLKYAVSRGDCVQSAPYKKIMSRIERAIIVSRV